MITELKPKIRDRELAVRIAKDVVKQLKAGRLNASHGYYIHFYPPVNEREDFKAAFKREAISLCTVCALGSLMIAWINEKDEYSVERVRRMGASSMRDQLSKAFDEQNIKLIEMVFEGWNHMSGFTPPEEDKEREELYDKIQWYGGKYKNSNDRLRAIMLNVVRNKGEFKLPKRMKKLVEEKRYGKV